MFRKTLLLILLIFTGIYSQAQFGFERSNAIDVFSDGELQKFAWVGGMDYCQFSNIDLNFDGVEDLFVFDRSSNKTLTFIQNGAEGETDYAYAPEYELLFPADMHDWALLVDYDCDGKKDIFTYGLGGSRVFHNTGTAATGVQFELVSSLLSTIIYGSAAYMFLSSQDIPAIVDIDGDGDKDVLAFGVLGRAVEYHKSMSMELYGVCDSLVFETKNICWGRFREDLSTNNVTLWDTLEYPCREEDLSDESIMPISQSQDRHAGSTILALDMDDSGVMDLVLGDVSYNNLTLLMNSGTLVNTNSGMITQDPAFPSTSEPVDLPIFPGAYHVDLNNDGKRDLLVSPNSKVGSQNEISVWRYMNEGEDLNPTFIKEESDFLQGDMIDNGTSSFPILFDHDGDGLKDLIVSAAGRYDESESAQYSDLKYYRNTGTAEVPVFEFVTDEYLGLRSLDIGNSLSFFPTFGDLDGDGDEDMILGEYIGYCYYMENTGGAGNPAIFSTFSLLNNSAGTPIYQGVYAYPNLVDLDKDGDLDLVIGRRTGTLEYYENTGVGSFNFEFRTNNLGNVDVSGAFIEGHAVPQFIEVDGEYQLLVGSRSGKIFYYDGIEDSIVSGSFHLVDASVDNIYTGTFSAPAVSTDLIAGNNKVEMVLGNRRGGVSLFESATLTNIGLKDLESNRQILIYPNPTKEAFTVDLGTITLNELKQTTISIYSLTGKLITTIRPTSNKSLLSTERISKGTYVVKVVGPLMSDDQKLIIQ